MGKSLPNTSSNRFWKNNRPEAPAKGRKFKIPNPKFQTNSKFQIPNGNMGNGPTFPPATTRKHESTKARRHNGTKMREARPRLSLPGNSFVSNRYTPERIVTVNVHVCYVLIFGSILACKVSRIGDKRAFLLRLLRCKQPSKIRFKFPESAFTQAARYPWN